jgi:glycerol uptake facilitator-like aquaporin
MNEHFHTMCMSDTNSNMRALAAEALGTFGLALIVLFGSNLAGGLGGGLLTSVCAALFLGLAVYTLGNISGTHINPSVTIGQWSVGKVSSMKAIQYILAQAVGAVIALTLYNALRENQAVGAISPVIGNLDARVMFFELLGAFFFNFGIAAVVRGNVKASMTGAVVGLSLLLGVAFASFGSAGVLNPAVAFAALGGKYSLAYLLGPIVGSVLAWWTMKLLNNDR